MTGEGNRVKIIFSDLYSKKNQMDNSLKRVVENYYNSREIEENYLLFWIRDRDINRLKEATEKFLFHLNDLVKIKQKLMGTKIK